MHCLWWNKSVSIWPPCASISSHWTSQIDLGSVSEILFSTWKNYHQTVRVVIFTLILKIIQVRPVSKHQGEERRKHRYHHETQHDPNQEWKRLSAGQTIQDNITPARSSHHQHRQSQRQINASSTPQPNSTKNLLENSNYDVFRIRGYNCECGCGCIYRQSLVKTPDLKT